MLPGPSSSWGSPNLPEPPLWFKASSLHRVSASQSPRMESFSGLVWLPRIVQLLSGPAALKALRCCRSLKRFRPRCLEAGEGFWVLEQLKTLTLEELLRRDEDLCNCFLWAKGDMESCKVKYWFGGPTLEIYASMPTPEPREAKAGQDEEPRPQVIVRSLSETFAAMDGNESFELTKRRLDLPPTMSQNLPDLFAGRLKVVGEESPALRALGLGGWEVSKTCGPCPPMDWFHFTFHRPKPKVPLAILHLSGFFDLAGGDGGCTVSLGYLSTDLDYVIALLDLCEYPCSRHVSVKVTTRWEEVEGLLRTPGPSRLPGLSREGTKMEEILAKITTPDGWEVECTTMYAHNAGDGQCVVGSPCLEAIYQDAERLTRDSN